MYSDEFRKCKKSLKIAYNNLFVSLELEDYPGRKILIEHYFPKTKVISRMNTKIFKFKLIIIIKMKISKWKR